MPSVRRLALFLLGTQAGWAQHVVSAHAGTINFVSGQVSVDGQAVHLNPSKFALLKNGQVLRTANGRAEILLGPAVFARLGDHAALRMVDNRLEDTQVKIEEGIALVEVVDVDRGSDVHIILGSTRTGFRGIGLHRFDADSTELRVFGGHAEVSTGGHTVGASRGRLVRLDDSLAVSHFDPGEKDALHRWAAARSFRLFISNPAARAYLTNWEVATIDASGVPVRSAQNRFCYSNRDFGATFTSGVPSNAASERQSPGSFTDLLPKQDPADQIHSRIVTGTPPPGQLPPSGNR